MLLKDADDLNRAVVRNIDGCMAMVVGIMNRNGIETLACCCGHAEYDMTLVAKIKGFPVEIFSGLRIPRKKKFYKKDKKTGYYYIPEVNQSKQEICECGHKQWDEHKSSFYGKHDTMVAQECNVKGCKCKKFKKANNKTGTK